MAGDVLVTSVATTDAEIIAALSGVAVVADSVIPLPSQTGNQGKFIIIKA